MKEQRKPEVSNDTQDRTRNSLLPIYPSLHPSIPPSIHPSIHPHRSNNQTNKHYTSQVGEEPPLQCIIIVVIPWSGLALLPFHSFLPPFAAMLQRYNVTMRDARIRKLCHVVTPHHHHHHDQQQQQQQQSTLWATLPPARSPLAHCYVLYDAVVSRTRLCDRSRKRRNGSLMEAQWKPSGRKRAGQVV